MSNINANTINIKGKNHKSVKNIMAGKCVFPFFYKGDMVNECVDGPKGLWCATKVNEQNKPVKIGFCKTKKTAKNTSKPKTKGKLTITTKAKSLKGKLSIKPKQIDLTKHLSPRTKKITPKSWELPNRKQFSNWVDTSFNNYRIEKKPAKLECAEVKECTKMELFSHQKLVRDFLQIDSPFRGILLYHGLGVGKTCAAIAIAEGLKNNRKIYILLNKSLKQNFKLELMKCGDDYYRLNNHWIFFKATPTKFDAYFSVLLDLSLIHI